MSSTKTWDWWRGDVDWSTPAGRLLRAFFDGLPTDRRFHFILFGSAPLQLTLNRTWTSADVNFFPTMTKTITSGSDASVSAKGRPTCTWNPATASAFEPLR